MKKKALRDGGNQEKKPSETVESKEKGSRRRWKSKNSGELLINQVFEKKDKIFEKKYTFRGGEVRVWAKEVKKFWGVAYKPSF